MGAANNELTNCVLILCDKTLENETERFATTLRSKCGHLLLETIESLMLKAKGKDLEQKLDNIINKYARRVLVICSPTFNQFMDKKSTDNCTDFFKKNHKIGRRFLVELFKKESKKKDKLVLVSFSDVQTLPHELQQMPMIKKGDDETLFINRVITEIIKMN